MTVQPATAPRVIACIAAVQAEIAQTGIAKNRNNQQQGYKFRGIDDVYNALAPILAKNGLVIVPRILARTVVEKTTKAGSALNYVTVEAEFDFIAAEDGSMVTARSFGEAMDSADKATNKAMSAAYKYTAFQTFCIPTEGDNDADNTTHEIVPRHSDPKPKQEKRDSAEGTYVESVRIAKTGKNAKGEEWKLIAVKFSDGVEAKTFSVGVAQKAKDLMQAGVPVTYEAETGEKGTDLVLVEQAP